MTFDDDPSTVRRVVLQHLRDHGDRTWKEIATGLLDGTTTLREVATSSAYHDQLTTATRTLLAHRDQVGQGAFDEHGRQAEVVIQELRERGSGTE